MSFSSRRHKLIQISMCAYVNVLGKYSFPKKNKNFEENHLKKTITKELYTYVFSHQIFFLFNFLLATRENTRRYRALRFVIYRNCEMSNEKNKQIISPFRTRVIVNLRRCVGDYKTDPFIDI